VRDSNGSFKEFLRLLINKEVLLNKEPDCFLKSKLIQISYIDGKELDKQSNRYARKYMCLFKVEDIWLIVVGDGFFISSKHKGCFNSYSQESIISPISSTIICSQDAIELIRREKEYYKSLPKYWKSQFLPREEVLKEFLRLVREGNPIDVNGDSEEEDILKMAVKLRVDNRLMDERYAKEKKETEDLERELRLKERLLEEERNKQETLERILRNISTGSGLKEEDSKFLLDMAHIKEDNEYVVFKLKTELYKMDYDYTPDYYDECGSYNDEYYEFKQPYKVVEKSKRVTVKYYEKTEGN
jgi:hypothetical protein